MPIKDALKECDILFLDDALAHANDVLARNAEVFPKGMPKDCAIAVLLYTYGRVLDYACTYFVRELLCEQG